MFLLALPPEPVPFLPCYAILNAQTMEVIDLTFMCGRPEPKQQKPTQQPLQQIGEVKALNAVADEYNDSYCLAIANGNSHEDAAAIAARDTRESRMFAFEEWDLTGVDVVDAAIARRECSE